MSFTVRFIFEGVCAFVPERPFFQRENNVWKSGDPGKVTVLLPALHASRSASWKENKRTVIREPHWAIVTVKEDRLERPSTGIERLPDLRWCGEFQFVENDQPKVAKGGWVSMALQQEKLRIEPGNAQALDVDLTIPRDPSEPSNQDWPSLWWLPRMEELEPGSRKVDKRLQPGADRLDNRLAASLEITQGKLSVLGFNLIRAGEKRKWVFTSPRRWWHGRSFSPEHLWKRPIGNTLALEFSGQTSPVKLFFKRDIESSILIKAPDGKTVCVFVSNMELEDRFLASVPRNADLPNQDPDFEDHYFLSRGAGASGPVPDRSASEAGLTRTPCAPGGFDGFSA